VSLDESNEFVSLELSVSSISIRGDELIRKIDSRAIGRIVYNKHISVMRVLVIVRAKVGLRSVAVAGSGECFVDKAAGKLEARSFKLG
jgi:hypothetical protein